MKQRLRLFNAVVTPTVLYGSSTWTMTKARERKLLVAQRRMLRRIVKVGRHAQNTDEAASDATSTATSSDAGDHESSDECEEDKKVDESWIQWIIRSTRAGEREMKGAKVGDWVEEQRRRKWKWAGHVMRRTDGRWSTAAANWKPEGKRKVGGQHRAWMDDIEDIVMEESRWGRGEWQMCAMDRDEWRSLEAKYCMRGA